MRSFWLLLSITSLTVSVVGGLWLSNHTYMDLVVSVDDRVQENVEIILKLRKILLRFSRHLYIASKQRVYIGEVKIVLPHWWKADGLTVYSDGKEAFNLADIRVGPKDSFYRNTPYTKQWPICGAKGDYIHVTDEWILLERNKCSLDILDVQGRTILHEFAHYRWGLFDEFPTWSTDRYYTDTAGLLQATRCGTHIRGLWRTDKQVKCDPLDDELQCDFVPLPANGDRLHGSLLYYPWVKGISQFCDSSDENPLSETKHNKLAPTMQNLICNGESAWDVMHNHSDFTKGHLTAHRFAPGLEPEPSFVYLRPLSRQRKLVVVIDNSDSMGIPIINSNSRKVKDALRMFLLHKLQGDFELAVTLFSHFPEIVFPLQSVSTFAKRKEAIESLNLLVPFGATGIGGAILNSLQLLGENATDGHSVLLITDGEENKSPFLDDIWQSVLNSRIRLSCILISESADKKLERLAKLTGGRTFYFSGLINDTSLHRAFSTMADDLERNGGDGSSLQQFYVRDFVLSRWEQKAFPVHLSLVDGWQPRFLFTVLNGRSADLEASVKSPSGLVYRSFPEPDDQSASSIAILITDNISEKEGSWITTIHALNPRLEGVNDKSLHVIVEVLASRVEQKHADGFVIDSRLRNTTVQFDDDMPAAVVETSFKYIDLPILGANLSASTPKLGTIALRDDGVRPDAVGGDGIYTGSFLMSKPDSERHDIVVTARNSSSMEIVAPIDRLTDCLPPQRYRSVKFSKGFHLHSSAGNVLMLGCKNDCQGKILPSPVTNIHLSKSSVIVEDHKVLSIRFPAPGSILEHGTVDGYEIRLSYAPDLLVKNVATGSLISQNMLITGDLNKAKAPGESQLFSVKLDDTATVVGLTVRARTEGRYGEWSPVVVADVSESESAMQEEALVLVLGGGSLLIVVLFILVIVLVFCCCCRRKRWDK